jgi:MinD superfamily P-loop ATPase
MKEMPVIDAEKCQGCGLCVDICSCGALVMKEKTVVIQDADQCGWCTLCELVCPYGAISCPFEIVVENGGHS